MLLSCCCSLFALQHDSSTTVLHYSTGGWLHSDSHHKYYAVKISKIGIILCRSTVGRSSCSGQQGSQNGLVRSWPASSRPPQDEAGQERTKPFALAMAAAMVAISLYELFAIQKTVGEILNEVKALREDLDYLGQKLIGWIAVVDHSEIRQSTMQGRCQDLMARITKTRALKPDGTEGPLDPDLIEFFDEEAVTVVILSIAEDLLGEEVAAGEQYMRAMFTRLKAEQQNSLEDAKGELVDDSFPSLLSRLIALRATYLTIYSYLLQGTRVLWVKGLWYGSDRARAKLGDEEADLLQRKTAKYVQQIAAKLTRVAEQVGDRRRRIRRIRRRFMPPTTSVYVSNSASFTRFTQLFVTPTVQLCSIR